MYVCMYVVFDTDNYLTSDLSVIGMRVCMYVCMYVCIYTSIYIHVCKYMYVCMYVCTTLSKFSPSEMMANRGITTLNKQM